jgi:hypothetical protein
LNYYRYKSYIAGKDVYYRVNPDDAFDWSVFWDGIWQDNTMNEEKEARPLYRPWTEECSKACTKITRKELFIELL